MFQLWKTFCSESRLAHFTNFKATSKLFKRHRPEHRSMVTNPFLPPSDVKVHCRMKTAGLIIIGDEVLKGQVVESNLAFLAPRLHNLGIKLQKVSIIPDSVEEIAREVSQFSSRFDTVITSGGIGPTHDDVTYEGVASAFGDELIISDEIIKFWSYFTGDSKALLTATRKEATIPKSSSILYPEVSTGVISRGKFPVVTVKNVLICPGVPKFLAAIFSGLEGIYFNSHGVVFYNKTIHLKVNEEKITDILNEAVAKFSPSVQFGSYPKFWNDYFKVALTLESENEAAVREAYSYLKNQFPPDWIAEGADLLCNAYSLTMEILKSDELGDFKMTLEDSIKVVDKCLDDYKISEIFISFNGGKDCTALLHLVHSVLVKRHGEKHYPSLNAVYFRPSNPFKEIEDFIHQASARYNLNLIVHEGNIKEGLQKLTNEKGKDWKACLMGVRRQDPKCADLNAFQETDEGWPKLMRVSPILDWSYKDVWVYLKKLNVPYCQLYDRGFTSLGTAGNTRPNPALQYIDADGKVMYRPAYMLDVDELERRGRITRISQSSD